MVGSGSSDTIPPVVLYIEDDAISTRLMTAILRQRPAVRLITAIDGHRGLALARAYLPDTILLDMRLPDMSGEDVLASLRQDPDLQRIPVLVVSAQPYPTDIARLQAAGVDGYITKPIDVDRFLANLDLLLGRA
jgi:CheY-like chemotaxis protein